MAPQGKRKGRPPIPPEKRKAANLTIRLRRNFLDWLRERAAENDRLLSEEAEARLQASARDDAFFRLMAPKAATLAQPVLAYLALLALHNIDPHAATAGVAGGVALIIDAVDSHGLSKSTALAFLIETKNLATKPGMGAAIDARNLAYTMLAECGLAPEPAKLLNAESEREDQARR